MTTELLPGALRVPALDRLVNFVPYPMPHPHRYPFELDLAHVIGRDAVQAALARGAYTCYLLGDVGGIVDPAPQRAVTAAMRALTSDSRRYDDAGAPHGGTLFAYIAGDVVYYHGEASEYQGQFYGPYRDYDRPIMAIPGNHDGDARDGSLAGFVDNFCAPYRAPSPFGGGLARPALDQPNVYWTLDAPWLRVIGLYTNVPEGGIVDDEQRRWFEAQLARPRDGKHLVVALHQPVFSVDRVHGGSSAMFEVVHGAAKRAGCCLVIAGHAHNYQRFVYDGMTYVVNGGGGYWELHDILPPASADALYPVVWHTRDHSLVHLSVAPDRLTARAIAVPLPFDPTVASPRVVDEFALPIAAGNR